LTSVTFVILISIFLSLQFKSFIEKNVLAWYLKSNKPHACPRILQYKEGFVCWEDEHANGGL